MPGTKKQQVITVPEGASNVVVFYRYVALGQEPTLSYTFYQQTIQKDINVRLLVKQIYAEGLNIEVAGRTRYIPPQSIVQIEVTKLGS